MLKNTFRHLTGFGELKERRLWANGITDWRIYETAVLKQLTLFPDAERSSLISELQDSRKAIAERNVDFFAERLPKREHYRIALSFPNDTLFVDIETTGLSLYYDEITLIGASLGCEYRFYIKGQPLDEIKRMFERAKCIVTFNGTLFDLKFLRKEYPNLLLPKTHVDLRFLVRNIGLKGGQKEIEHKIGVDRHQVADIDGKVAPLLWYNYKMGDETSLKRLIEYNHADVEGMKAIFDFVADEILAKNEVITSQGLEKRFSALKSDLPWSDSNGQVNRDDTRLPPYVGRRGPSIIFEELMRGEKRRSPDLTVVGIDLTGSSSRPSGWCVLRGSEASTLRLGDDDEIISHTLAVKPHVVSLDSPLSLPVGRLKVTDDDKARDEHGITRACERMLKQRGINVYPCLIPSMQSLTERGIRLATKLRKAGVPVIESYPGAAQDIMGIPRKRAGLTHLIKGLSDFGIEGDFVKGDLSHDELDAITAAIVGAFFWQGRFEALGNEAEDYLIVPELHVPCHAWHKKHVIGISGPIAAGKTSAANVLKKLGYAYTRYSLVLASILSSRGQEVDRFTLQRLGNEINQKPGQRWLNQELLRQLSQDTDFIVVDGLRFPEDHAFLTERFGPKFLHVYVDAPKQLCQKRYTALGFTAETFIKAIEHPVEQAVESMAELAHTQINNTNTIETLETRMVQLVSSWCSKEVA